MLLEHHNTKAVHTAEEINLLHDNFPENIRLYAAMKDDIGIWNEETKTLDFSRINSDGKKFVMYLDFEDDYRNGFIIDNEIFEVLNEFGEL